MTEGFKNEMFSQNEALKRLKQMKDSLEKKIQEIKVKNADALDRGVPVVGLQDLENSLADIENIISLVEKELNN